MSDDYKTIKSFADNTYAYICDKKACDGTCPGNTPCMHTLNPEHSKTLQEGKNAVFVKLASHRFFEVENLSKMQDIFY